MKNFILLTKIQLKGNLDLSKMFNIRKSKTLSKGLLTIIGLIMLVFFFFISGIYSYTTADMLEQMGALDLLPGLWITITSVIVLITSIYKVKGTLFSFSDYDMVMSLPVPTSSIVASRISVLYLYDLLFAIIIMLPANIIYGFLSGGTALYYLLSTLLMLFIPIVPVIIGTVIGLAVTIVSSKFRHSNFISLVLLIAVFVTYMIAVMSASSSPEATEQLMNLTNNMGKQVTRIYPLASFYMLAVTELAFLPAIKYLLISLFFLTVYCYVIGGGFKKLNTMIVSKQSRSNYKLQELNTSSITRSLYKREIKRFFASPMYVMNAAIGLIMLTVSSVIMIVSGPEKLVEIISIPEIANQLALYIPIVILFCCCTNSSTASSISLEGKNLWIYQSLPLRPSQIFRGKILVSLTLSVPFIVLDTIIFGYQLKMNVFQILLTLLLPCAGACFMSYFGLMLNLWFPRFDWKSELEIAKQGLPAFISIFGGMVVGILPVVSIIVFPSLELKYVLVVYTAVLAIFSLIFRQYINTKGMKLFYSLASR